MNSRLTLNLPNLLTLLRIALIPVIVALFFIETRTSLWLAFAAYIVAAVTDYIDGYLARKWNQESDFGRAMDPIADKMLVCAVIFMLIAIRHIEGWALVAALLILLREILVSGLREAMAPQGVTMPVSKLAKWKTAVQMVALGALIISTVSHPALLIEEIGIVSLWLACGLTLVTGWDYFVIWARTLRS